MRSKDGEGQGVQQTGRSICPPRSGDRARRTEKRTSCSRVHRLRGRHLGSGMTSENQSPGIRAREQQPGRQQAVGQLPHRRSPHKERTMSPSCKDQKLAVQKGISEIFWAEGRLHQGCLDWRTLASLMSSQLTHPQSQATPSAGASTPENRRFQEHTSFPVVGA